MAPLFSGGHGNQTFDPDSQNLALRRGQCRRCRVGVYDDPEQREHGDEEHRPEHGEGGCLSRHARSPLRNPAGAPPPTRPSPASRRPGPKTGTRGPLRTTAPARLPNTRLAGGTRRFDHRTDLRASEASSTHSSSGDELPAASVEKPTSIPVHARRTPWNRRATPTCR
jgi:hypothetical protein